MTSTLALLAASLGLGMLARRLRGFPETTPQVVNAMVLDVALPALVVRELHDVALTPTLAVAAGVIWVQFLVGIAVFVAIGRVMGLPSRTVGALILTGGLSNTAFVGLPVIEAALGREALAQAVMMDQLGSFLVMATLGVVVAARASGHATGAGEIARKVLLFPPFIALAVAVALRPVDFPPWVVTTLDRFAALLTPLALFSVGFQLRRAGLGGRVPLLGLGLGYKLVLAPIVCGALLAPLLAPATLAWKIAFLQCAMPPMVTGGILAAQHDCDPALAAAMLGVGIPLSAFTLAAAIAWVS